MATTYSVMNAAVNTTAAPVRVATGTAIKTLLQVATPATRPITVISWGISFDGVDATKTPVAVELIQTDVAATSGTAVTPTVWGPPDAPASLCAGGTGTTCFSPTSEGTTTASRLFDYVDLTPNGGIYKMQFPLGREPVVPISKFLRVRVTAGTTVNALCQIVWEE